MKHVVWLLLAVSCGPIGTGTVQVRASGGERAESGFPPALLKDKWAIRFTKYIVSVGELELRRDEMRDVRPGAHVVDIQKGTRALFSWPKVPAGRWGVGFQIRPPPADAVIHDVSQVDVDEMRARGWAYLLEGRATKTGVGSYPFRIGLSLNHRYDDCTNGEDGTLGIIVSDGTTATAEVTIHVDHLFYDKLGTHRGVNLRFEAWSALEPVEKMLTLESLGRQDLLDLKNSQGGALLDADGSRVLYDPASFDVRTLDAFVVQSLKDQAHLNGGGLCNVKALP
jgi:hypothetical protein